MLSTCYQTGDMRHIHHQISPNFICDLTEFLKINNSGIGTCTCYDQLWFILNCNSSDFFIIDHAVII